MLFKNEQIDISQIPSLKALEFQPLERNYLKVRLINHIILFLFFAIAACLFVLIILKKNDDVDLLTLILIVTAIWGTLFISSIVYMSFAFKFKAFAIREHDIVYRSGWWWRKITTVPFNRIQHCELSQGPVEKYFSLAKLNVYTAGGQSSDLKLPGLLFEKANNLKEFLVNKTHKPGNAEL